uniref:alanine transaminase n=1 Tax=Periophthalmus magnuspinnatus TaxID=409849 RepID=A0A3B4B3M7_9GOBI
MSVVLREISPNIRSIRPPRYTALSVRAAQIREELRQVRFIYSSLDFLHHLIKTNRSSTCVFVQGVKKPYTELIDVTWGDPQGAGLKPLTFARQVLAACLYPKLLNNERLPADVRQRAEGLLHECHGGSVGSYTDLPGIPQVARQISEFISRRDGGVPSDPDHILISPGSQWHFTTLPLLICGGGGVRSGVLTPQPSYSLSVMSVVGLGGVPVPYQLWEEQGWEVQVEELNRALEAAEGECDPVALYVINPGNPSGHVQRRKSIQDVIKFASEKRLFLLADEVYQDCIYKENIEFLSYKRVLAEMGPPFCDTVELASFHSASKGLLGEYVCGFRGGYVELVNMDPAVMKHVFTIFSKDNAPTPGQIALSVMASPPQPGDPSYPLYRTKQQMQTLIKDNVRKVHEVLNSLPGVSSHPVEGGAFAFPRIDLPPKAIQKAKDLGMEPDIFYCLRLLEDAGLFFTPGCEYGQKDGTYHVRYAKKRFHVEYKDLNTKIKQYYFSLAGFAS